MIFLLFFLSWAKESNTPGSDVEMLTGDDLLEKKIPKNPPSAESFTDWMCSRDAISTSSVFNPCNHATCCVRQTGSNIIEDYCNQMEQVFIDLNGMSKPSQGFLSFFSFFAKRLEPQAKHSVIWSLSLEGF